MNPAEYQQLTWLVVWGMGGEDGGGAGVHRLLLLFR
jgi:hypothetical protein